MRFNKPMKYNLDKSSIDYQVIKQVANFFGYEPEILLSTTRKQAIVKPRFIAMYFIKFLLQRPYSAVGIAFNRDHSTVIHACKMVDDQIEVDRKYKYDFVQVKKIVQNFIDNALPNERLEKQIDDDVEYLINLKNEPQVVDIINK